VSLQNESPVVKYNSMCKACRVLWVSSGLFTLEDGTDRLSRKDGKELPLPAA